MRYNPPETVLLKVDRHWHGTRLDKFVTSYLRWRSRTSMQEGIAEGQITLNGEQAKASTRVQAGDSVRIDPRPDLLPPFDPESVPIDILFEDPFLLAINKPPGLVVHATCSHLADNLINVLQHHYRGHEGPGGPVRPKLAHRIDGNTSGALLLTKQESVRAKVADQFARRTVKKGYHALIHGVPHQERFTVDAPIDKDPSAERIVKRAVVEGGQPSKTNFQVLANFGRFSLVACEPVTGRTHQIRVHLAWAGFPILCDDLYGRETALTRSDLLGRGNVDEVVLSRHALHSRTLAFTHPVEENSVELTAPYTKDLEEVLAVLRETG
ncbi:MAG: RluA family pseudouridine synthase [Planctomycetota bacterium]|jgi:23S rRNA pseudouridine1911/1915/1917 synthase